MVENRPTFEIAYKEIVVKSSIYELNQINSKAWPQSVQTAIDTDERIINNLIDKLCEDMTKLFNKKIAVSIKFRLYPSSYQINECYDFYLRMLPRFIDEKINNLSPNNYSPTIEFVKYPKIGLLKWNGTNVEINLMGITEEKIKVENAEIKNINDYPDRTSHITKILSILEKTHYEYEPYILTGSNDKKILAIRLGDSWKDIAIADWDYPYSGIDAIDNRILGCTLGLFGVSCWGAFKFENLFIQVLFMIIGFVSFACIILLSILFYKKNFTHIEI